MAVVEPLIELTLKPELEPVKEDLKISEHIATSLTKLFPELPQVADAIESTIAEKSGNTLLHHNMMHYLTLAYDNHFSVVISPDMIFYTILCELASTIKEKPDAFRFLFTNSGDKIKLTTMTHDPAKIDLNQVISGIASNIAVDASIFTADFSCSTPEARLAIQAAFCDAMSPYFYYETTRCGIPRIKVIGSQQDWLKLETKVHRMATEVFNQVGDAKLTKYIFGARDTVNKMRTQTDVEFWSKIFSIERCHSGHTDLVVGWITSLFRQGTDDYYKYESHISTVEWTNIDTGNEYQMRTGLLYSHIREGSSDLDKQFPWLEPQFAHIIINKNAKMNSDQYRTYVTKVLKGADKKIFLGFFDVLKDESLIIDTKGGRPETQRLAIVGRQFDYWSSHPDLPVDLNLNDDKFGAALTTYGSEDYTKEIDAVFEKLKKVFDTCQVRSLVLPDWRTNMLFKKSANMLKLLTGKFCLEELTITCMSDEVFNALNQLLTHQECRVKSLNMDARDFSAKYSAKLADALLNMKSPLKKFASNVVPDMKLANAIHTLITNGTLNSIIIASARDTEQMMSRVIKALIQSKTVEEVELPSIDGYDELLEQLAKAWKGNQTLKSVTINRWKHEEKWLNMALTLPSLKSLTLNMTCDLEFLARLPQLEKLKIKKRNDVTLVAASHIASALASGKCQLKALIIDSKVAPNALIALTAGLAVNRSLKVFKCHLEEDPDEGTEELTQSFLTQQGLEEIEIDGCLRAPAAQENFIKLIEEHKTIKKAHYCTRYYYDEVKWPQEERLRKAIRDGGVAVKVLVN